MRALFVLVVGSALVLSCSAEPPTASLVAAAGRPILAIVSPTDGSVVQAGQDVLVAGTALDTVGVDHVELVVDGMVIADSPAGQPAQQLPFALHWLPTVPEQGALAVTAYRADGTASLPTTVVVTVIAATGSAPPPLTSLPPGQTARPPTAVPPTTGPGGSGQPPSTQRTRPTTAATSPTGATSPPATAAPATATPTAVPPATQAVGPVAPDDSGSDPHFLDATETRCGSVSVVCPPVAETFGRVTGEISAPTGDNQDQILFTAVNGYSYYLTVTCGTPGPLQWRLSIGNNVYAFTKHCGDDLTTQYMSSNDVGTVTFDLSDPGYAKFTIHIYAIPPPS